MNEVQTETKKELFPKPFYRIKEVSDLLSIGVSTIYLYQNQGSFPKPTVLSTRLSVYSGESLQNWVDNVMPEIGFVSKQPEATRKRFYN